MKANYQQELKKAFDDFVIKVNRAQKDYNQKIEKILKKIDELKIAKVRKNLNI